MLTTCTLNKINWGCSVYFGTVLADEQFYFSVVEERERKAASGHMFCISTDPFISHSSLPVFPAFLGLHISASVSLCFEAFKK